MKEYIDFSTGPLPDLEDQESSAFWEGTRQKEIRFPKCRSCNKYRWYPTVLCPYCHSSEFDWVALKSQPKLYSWSVVKMDGPMWNVGKKTGNGQRIVGVVEFEEAPDLLLATNIVDCLPEDLEVDMPLEVIFQKVNDLVTMPLFKPKKTKSS
jgi:uncharacterized protein